jgi:hypothetical protein
MYLCQKKKYKRNDQNRMNNFLRFKKLSLSFFLFSPSIFINFHLYEIKLDGRSKKERKSVSRKAFYFHLKDGFEEKKGQVFVLMFNLHVKMRLLFSSRQLLTRKQILFGHEKSGKDTTFHQQKAPGFAGR